MRDAIDDMTGHTIICGYGEVGRAIATELKEEHCDLVIIDRDEAVSEEGLIFLHAEATEDETLLDAGIERAETLVLAFNSDVANLYVALSARTLRPDLFIVARTNSPSTAAKLESAGADRVINPNEIGAARMASVARHAGVVTYFDELMPETSAAEILVREYRIPADSILARRQIGSSAVGEQWPGAVLAVERYGQWLRTPADDFELSPGDVLVLLGSHAQLAVLVNRLDAGES